MSEQRRPDILAAWIVNQIDGKFCEEYVTRADAPVGGNPTLIKVVFRGVAYMVKVVGPVPIVKEDQGVRGDAGEDAGADPGGSGGDAGGDRQP